MMPFIVYSLSSHLWNIILLDDITIHDWDRSSVCQITNHEEVISQSLNTEETKTKVVNFLSKVTKRGQHRHAGRIQGPPPP